MKKILLIISCVFLIAGCDKKVTVEIVDNFEDVKVELKDQEVEVNSDLLNTAGLVNIEHGEVVSKEENIDTSKLGEQEVTIVVKNERDEEKEFIYKVNVIDTKAPVITAKDKINTTEGTKISLTKNVTVTDNSKEKIDVKVEGKYDLNKAGTYKLQYVAKDSSGNEAKKDFTLVVKEKVVEEEKKVTTTEKKTTTTNTKSTAKAGKGTDPSLNGTKTSKGYTITVKNGVTYIDGVLIANKTYALPSTYKTNGLTSSTASASKKLISAAKSAGYNIRVASGFRSYSTQKNLYNNYVNSRGKSAADTFSARPGHSEHQTGLAFDVCGSSKYVTQVLKDGSKQKVLSSDVCINSGFDSTLEAKWLAANAYKYGFVLRYPSGKTVKTGYKYESWHFRYVGVDLATKLYNNGNWITLEEHFGITSKYDY